MSDNSYHSQSFTETFKGLNICEEQNNAINKYGACVPQEPSSGTHDNLTCRMPQTAGDVDNSDDTDSDSESDAYVVVDSSEASSVVSFIRQSDLSTASDLAWDTILETETESESAIEVNGSIAAAVTSMANLKSTPIKRRHESFPSSREKQTRNRALNLSSDVESTPLRPSKVITTRSGRAVRQRIDHKFDYSSPEHEYQSDDSSGDPDFRDSHDADEDDGDDENDEDYNQQEHAEPTGKQRRISMRSSCSGSSSNDSSRTSSSMAEYNALIYLDLRQPVAIVSSEPTSEAGVEHDSELKTRLQKFLGLMPAQRRLYNPMANYELQDNEMDADSAPPLQSSRLWSSSMASKTPAAAKAAAPANSMLSLATKLNLKSQITNEMRMLLIDDMVQRTNANCFESQTPQHIKEPIDLSGLPSIQQRLKNCQQHKKITSLLKPYAGVYNLVDSLRSETPLNMCHPLAVYYRKRDFETTKNMLAKTLYSVFNHSIFHCGLRVSITWKLTMNTPSTIVHGFDAQGQRTSRIIMWQQMKHPGVLVKALLHEMCHAAAFVYHGETGHGDHCRKWAYRAKSLMPELPQIDDCRAGYKYTCLLCRGHSFGIIKFEDEEQQLRCHYCQFEVNVETCSSDDEAHNLSITDQLVTPYKQFVRGNYLKCEESSHSSKMRELNQQYKDQLHTT